MVIFLFIIGIFSSTPKDTNIVDLGRFSSKKNLSKLNFKTISENVEEIKKIYGDVLCYSMKPEERIDLKINHCVFDSYVQAFKDHRPITISPDIVWLLIIQSFANHVNNNSGELRSMLVNFYGKKELSVKRKDITPETATIEDWTGMFDEFVEQIKNYTGEELTNTLQPNFTTTSPTSLSVGQLTIMSAMKEYFDYHVIMCICSFPYIVVEGTAEDWKKIIEKIEVLKKFNLQEWVNKLTPILSKILDTKNGNIDYDFWKNMIHIVTSEDVYRPGYVDGWFVTFFLYNIYGEKVNGKVRSNDDDLTSEVLTIPFKLTIENTVSKTYDYEFLAGFIGVSQDQEYMSIKPEIGWIIRPEDKKAKAEYKGKLEEKKRDARLLGRQAAVKHSKGVLDDTKNYNEL